MFSGVLIMKTLLGTDPMVVEWVEDTVTELSISHRATDFSFLIIANLYLRKERTTAFTCLPHLPGYVRLLMNRAATRCAKCLFQSAKWGRGGQAVRLPAVGQLLLQSRCQGLHSTNRRLLHCIRIHKGRGKTVYVSVVWAGKRRGMMGEKDYHVLHKLSLSGHLKCWKSLKAHMDSIIIVFTKFRWNSNLIHHNYCFCV